VKSGNRADHGLNNQDKRDIKVILINNVQNITPDFQNKLFPKFLPLITKCGIFLAFVLGIKLTETLGSE
jgi:hypothetical protein